MARFRLNFVGPGELHPKQTFISAWFHCLSWITRHGMREGIGGGIVAKQTDEAGVSTTGGGLFARRGLIALLGAAFLAGCGGGSEASYRFRMTVEVETPQGLRTGSSVMEIMSERQAKVLSEARPMISTVKGEAVAVDLPSGPLFVLLQMPDARTTYISAVTYALAPDLREGGWEPFWKAVNRLGGWFGSASGEMPREDWPMMVRFRNLADPKSVERVDPDAFGVKRILLETTGDDVTTGIEKRLGWLNDLKLFRTDPSNPFTNTLPAEIGYLRSGTK